MNIEQQHIHGKHGIGGISAALLMPALFAGTIALSGCNSSDYSALQPSDELNTEEHSVAGTSKVTTQEKDAIANQHNAQQSGQFSASFAALDCLEMTSPEVVADLLQNDPAITCGYVTVPANWERLNGDTIELAVYRVATTTDAPASDPVVVLAGGPGQPGISILPDFVDGDIAYLRARSEVVVVDQRGTGFSTPSLVCPDVAAIRQRDNTDVAPKTNEAFYPAMEEAFLACAEDLVTRNVNLADYTTANNARDIDAIRQALDIDQWNLFGVSYGTTLALTIMRDWADGVRSAILDSVLPTQANLLTEQTYTKGYWPLSRIVENCKADADCNEIIGDIQLSIEAGIARLAAAPIGRLDAQRYLTDTLIRNIGDPDLATIIQVVAFMSDEDIAQFFNLNTELDSTADAPVETLDNDSVPTPIADTPPGLIPLLLADVKYIAVVCAEEIPNAGATASPDISGSFKQTTREVIQQMVDTAAYSDNFCKQLGILPADPIESHAVRSNLPVLILAGDTDSLTPPAWSQRAAETLPNSQYVEFPRAGHGLTLKGFNCSTDLLLSFLDAPEKTIDRNCVNALPPVDYRIWTEH